MKRHEPRPGLLLSLAAATLLAGCGPSRDLRSSSAPRLAERGLPQRGYDVQHYKIELSLLPEQRRIVGQCSVRLTATDPLEEVVLDLKGLEVLGVRDAALGELSWRREGDLLRITPALPLGVGASAELVVAYGGRPVTGLWFSGRRADGSGPNQVFTQGEATHSRGWFPCFDHPSDRATSEVVVTMPAGWVSLAAGEQLSSTEEGGARTDHWRMDFSHPAYLTTLVAGEFVLRRSDWEGTPLLFVGEAQDEPYFEATFAETDEILGFLSRYTGRRYPYSKYGQALVDNFMWGGMENVSATTLTQLTLDEERGHRDETSHGLIAHEAAHQWFGDLLTCNDWSHIWLNEGFATYMTELYFEETRGVDFFRARMRDNQEEYLAEDVGPKRRPTISDRFKEPEDLFDTRSYQGAAARLHLLRFLLGDGVFQEGVRAYVERFQDKSVVTSDFQGVMEEISGRDLDTFFEQWFAAQGYPEFQLDWRYEERKQRVVLDVDQMQAAFGRTPAAFRLPVDVEIRDSRGSRTHRIELAQRSESFSFPADERPYYVQFDKHGWIPKRVTWLRREAAEWLAIITADGDVNARRDAARALGAIAAELRAANTSNEVYVAELADRLARDASPWVRADAATALAQAGSLEARERLVYASGNDPEARVRAAALEALWTWTPNPDLAVLGTRRFEEAYSWKTMAAAAGLVVRADPEHAFDWLRERIALPSPHGELAALLFPHLAIVDDPRVAEELLRWARDESLEPTARGAALVSLARIQRGRANHARAIAPFLEAESHRLRQAAIEALGSLGDHSAKEALRAYYPATRTHRERRAIEASLAAGGPSSGPRS